MRGIAVAGRGLRAAAVAAALTAFAAPLAADQTDPRLDQLFAVLQTTESADHVAIVERLIWRLWMQREDREAARLMRRGVAAMAAHRLDRAVEIFTALVDRAPDFAEAWNKRATVYFLQGRLAASIADVDATLRLEPRHFGALSGLGRIYLLQDDKERALRAFDDALAVHPHLGAARAITEALRRELAGDAL